MLEFLSFIIIIALLIYFLDKNARLQRIQDTFIEEKVFNYAKIDFKDVKLSIELVPETCWYSNVRSAVTKEQWDIIRRANYKKANYKCEICGGKGPTHPVECHEIWNYNDDTKTQKLVRFIALCPNCHKVKHIGLNGVDENISWLMKINNWDKVTANKYVDCCFAIWSHRNRSRWKLDISYMKKEFNI